MWMVFEDVVGEAKQGRGMSVLVSGGEGRCVVVCSTARWLLWVVSYGGSGRPFGDCVNDDYKVHDE